MHKAGIPSIFDSHLWAGVGGSDHFERDSRVLNVWAICGVLDVLDPHVVTDERIGTTHCQLTLIVVDLELSELASGAVEENLPPDAVLVEDASDSICCALGHSESAR